MTDLGRPRPLAVGVLPLAWAVLAAANVLLGVLMWLVDGLPDPLVVFATAVAGWYPVPLPALLAGGLAAAATAAAAAIAARRRLLAGRAGAHTLARAVNIGVPALVGLVMPSVWWQVGERATPRGIDPLTSQTHLFLAAAALVVPAGLELWWWWRARRTLGAEARTGVPVAPDVTTVSESWAGRSVAAVVNDLDAGLARELTLGVMAHLRFHSGYLPLPALYQFRLPNGAYLTLNDSMVAERRCLAILMQSPARVGHLTRSWVIRPATSPQHGPWFSDPADSRTERSALKTLTHRMRAAFATQDAERLPDAIVLDPTEEPRRIVPPGR